MSFLSALGSIAGGAAGPLQSAFNNNMQLYQQALDNALTGQAGYAMAGVPLPGASPALGGGGGLGALGPMLGQMPSMASNAPNAPVDVPSPSSSPAVSGAAGSASPLATQPAPAPLPKGAPMTPSGDQMGPQTWAQQQASQQASQGQQPTFQPQPAQLSPTVQQQQAQPRPAPDLSMHAGMYDVGTLMQNLIRQPGMNPMRLGAIMNSPHFMNMLNQTGLQQYKMLGLGMQQERADIARERLSQSADEFTRREAAIAKRQQTSIAFRQALAASAAKLQALNKDAQSRIGVIQAQLTQGKIEPADAQKQIEAINKDREDKIQSGIDELNKFKVDSEEAPAEGDGGGPDVIYDNKTGKEYRYKGSGDRSDIKNYSPVQ